VIEIGPREFMCVGASRRSTIRMCFSTWARRRDHLPYCSTLYLTTPRSIRARRGRPNAPSSRPRLEPVGAVRTIVVAGPESAD